MRNPANQLEKGKIFMKLCCISLFAFPIHSDLNLFYALRNITVAGGNFGGNIRKYFPLSKGATIQILILAQNIISLRISHT